VELAAAFVALLPLPSRLLVISATAFIILVTVPLSTGDVGAGYGCRRAIAGATSRNIYLVRNGILLALTAAHLRDGRRRWRAAATVVLGFALLVTGCARPSGLGQDFFSTAGHRAYLAPFHPADFHHPTVFTNPYFPLVVGATWRWKGQFRGRPYTQEDLVLNYTRRIDGVVTRPVLDRDLVKG